MQTEIEAKFIDVDKDEIIKKIKDSGGVLVREEYIQKKYNFHLPGDKRSINSWLRVRDEGDKITLSLKMILGGEITDQKETTLTIDNFDQAVSLLEDIGCERKALQESKRELWRIDDADITIDTWPALNTFVEIEAPSEESVKKVSAQLGFDFSTAIFGGVGKLYKMKYGKYLDEIEKEYGDITFSNEKLLNIA